MATSHVLTIGAALFVHLAVIGAADTIPSFENWRMIASVAGGGRSPLRTDAIEHQIVMGTWRSPQSGDVVTRGDGQTRTWSAATPNAEGWIEDDGLAGGYVFATAKCDSPTIAILDAAGHSMVYVNGEPRMGDPYAYGYLQLPIELKAGENTFLFRVDRGRVKARLAAPKPGVYFNIADPTLPDQVVGETERMLGAVVIVNAAREPVPAGKFKIRSSFAGGVAEVDVPGILPLTIRKVPISIAARPELPPGEAPLRLELLTSGGATADSAELVMRIADKQDWRRITFESGIDGSVQYYCMWPPAAGGDPNQLPGLIFTVHGASVEATNQIKAYTPKTWAYIVAPTNRRPYGFDWEDWGRLDALEVWDHFLARHKTDELRRWLTGHSMGGHGTWQLGGHFPDRFAAIAPCSGWVSFFSYANQKEFHPVQGDSKIAELLRRATNPSDTLGLSNNWKHYGIYVLHGDADDNVPVTEARTMRERLGQFHTDFCYYEKPGAGHWWDNTAVDWPPLMEFIKARSRRPASDVREIDFTTVSPAISSTSHWVSVLAQEKVLAPSRVKIAFEPNSARLVGTTENVTSLLISTKPPDVSHDSPGLEVAPPLQLEVELDGQSITVNPTARTMGFFSLCRSDGTWRVCEDRPGAPRRESTRTHLLKSAFASRMRLIYGTAGTADENAWSLAKVRFDAEQWYYRGNGSVDIVSDRALDVLNPRAGGLIIYGNASTNLAFKPLLNDSHVTAERGGANLGARRIAGDTLAALILHNRSGPGVTLVAAIAPTGPIGMRLCDRLPYFVSGVAYPDVTVLSPDVLTKGLPGVVATGFLGQDGTVENGEFGFEE